MEESSLFPRSCGAPWFADRKFSPNSYPCALLQIDLNGRDLREFGAIVCQAFAKLVPGPDGYSVGIDEAERPLVERRFAKSIPAKVLDGVQPGKLSAFTVSASVLCRMTVSIVYDSAGQPAAIMSVILAKDTPAGEAVLTLTELVGVVSSCSDLVCGGIELHFMPNLEPWESLSPHSGSHVWDAEMIRSLVRSYFGRTFLSKTLIDGLGSKIAGSGLVAEESSSYWTIDAWPIGNFDYEAALKLRSIVRPRLAGWMSTMALAGQLPFAEGPFVPSALADALALAERSPALLLERACLPPEAEQMLDGDSGQILIVTPNDSVKPYLRWTINSIGAAIDRGITAGHIATNSFAAIAPSDHQDGIVLNYEVTGYPTDFLVSVLLGSAQWLRGVGVPSNTNRDTLPLSTGLRIL